MSGYALFAGDVYYPQGGWHDLIGRFATKDEAIARGIAEYDTPYAWWHVVDVATGELLAEHEAGKATGGWEGLPEEATPKERWFIREDGTVDRVKKEAS